MKISMLAGLFLLAALPARAATVVELFQSQGCSSCPPAIANVNALADRPNILALTFAVTYWDQLGWKDTFAKPVFTARQHDYARGLRRANVYTPQIVINGRADLDGITRGPLLAAIDRTVPLSGPALFFSATAVTVAAAQGDADANADVWLVRYDPRALNVPIRAGENSGVTIAHRNVVRDLVRLGSWTGTAQRYDIAVGDPALRTAVLVQGRNGGPILSASVMPAS